MAKNQAPQADEVDQLLALNKTTGTPSGGGRSGSAVDAFVREVRPIADAVSRELGVDPSYLIGQWGLETGWGKSVIPGTNNYGNIKDFRGGGKSAKDNMTGSVDKYRAYGSPDDFAKDYAQLLRGQRYSSAMGSKDAQSFFSALKAGGYAEDPNYVRSGVRAAEMARNAMGGSSSGASLYPTRGEYIGNTGKVMRDAERQAKSDESPLSTSIERGINSVGHNIGLFVDTLADDNEGAAERIKAKREWDEANPAPSSSTKFVEHWQKLAEDNYTGMAGAVLSNPSGMLNQLVEQTPNSLPGLALQIPVAIATTGLMATGWGAPLAIGLQGVASFVGNVLPEGGAVVEERLAKAGINPNDTQAVARWMAENRGANLEAGTKKAGVISAVDGVTGYMAGKLIAGPSAKFAQAEAKAFADAGIDASNKAARDAARATPTYKAAMAQPAQELMAATTKAQKFIRHAGGFAAESVGEGVGEYAGSYAAHGEASVKDAVLESLMGAGTSAAMTGAGSVMGAMKAPEMDRSALEALAATPVQPTIQPNSPLANAAGIAQAAAPQPAAVDPFDGRLSAVQSFVEDKAFIQALRGAQGYGPESVTEFLSAFVKARNPNLDPMVRERALSDLEGFIQGFSSRPNFVFGQNAQGRTQAPGQQVATVSPQGGAVTNPTQRDDGRTLNGEIITRPSTMAGANPNQISAPPVLGLPTEEALQAKRDADAAYEQAYQDLVKSESLGASDQDLAARQQAIREARAAREQADARMQEIERAIEGNRTQQTAEKRRAVLDAILADPATANPAARLAAELKRQGFRDTTPTQAELDTIQRFSDIKNAEVEPDIIPSSPNELDPYQARQERPQQPAKPRLTVEQIKQAIANGATLSKDVLTLPDGSRVKLKGPQIAAARQAILKKAQDGASNERPNAEVAPQAPESGSPVVQGGAGDAPANDDGRPAAGDDDNARVVEPSLRTDAPDGNGGVAEPSTETFDVSTRTDDQLRYLAEKGKAGWREAAQAELAKRTPADVSLTNEGKTTQPESQAEAKADGAVPVEASVAQGVEPSPAASERSEGFNPAGLQPGTPEYNAAYDDWSARQAERRRSSEVQRQRAENLAAIERRNEWRKAVIRWFESARDGDTLTTDVDGELFRVVERTIKRNGKEIRQKRLVAVGARGENLDMTIIEYRDGQPYGAINTNLGIDPDTGASMPETDPDSRTADLGMLLENGKAQTHRADTASGEFDVSTRTDDQLRYLAEKGKAGWREAAQAELAKRTPADVSLTNEGKTTQAVEPEAENVDPLDKEISDAAAHLADVLADVFGAKLNITGPQHTAADLLPAMQKVIGLLIQKGFKTFSQAVGQTARMLRDNGAGDHVEKITPRQWKAAYQFAADMPGVEGAESEEAVAALSADKVQAIVSGHVDKAKAEAEARTDTNPSEAPAQPAETPDVSTRTDDQLQYLANNGKPGWKEAAQAEMARREGAKPAEFEHRGVRIYPANVSIAGERKQMWGVESSANKAKREAGERHGFGDSLHETREQAIDAADRQIREDRERAEYDRRMEEIAAKKRADDAARKADTINGFLEGKAPNTQELIRKALDKQYRFDGTVMTVRERIESLRESDELVTDSFEEPKIKPMSRVQFNRASQREQDAHEKKMREAGTKTVYTVSGSELGKYAYDYAQHLLTRGTTGEVKAEIRSDLDAAAHEAATSPLNDTPQPTDGQKSAGNYKVGRVRVQGMDISIENPKGSVRSGTSPDGRKWESTLRAHYGYFTGTKAADGDHLDVYLTDGAEDAPMVWVIDQKNADGTFDEHKTLLGPRTEEEAKAAYLANYEPGWDGIGAISSMPIEAFKAWAFDGKKKRKPLAYVVPEVIATVESSPGSDAGNGFKHGPQAGERYRVGQVSSVGGAIALEKRLPAGTDATFYVGVDGILIDGDSLNLISNESRDRLWIPANSEQASQALHILDEMGRLALSDPRRAEMKRQLKSLVTNSAQPTQVPGESDPREAYANQKAEAYIAQRGGNAPPKAVEVVRIGARKEFDKAEAIHKDPGQPAEAVTPAVVAESIQKSARNTEFNPVEAKKWLLGEIDKAVANVPAENAELGVDLARYKSAAYEKETTRQFGVKEFKARRNSNIDRLSKQIGFVTFDVPGDGKFKVMNTVDGLNAFRKKVEASPGFKTPSISRSAGPSLAAGPGLDQSIADAKKFGGSVLAEIGNAIEISRLRGKEDDTLLDRFKENSGGKSYDDWRAEQEAADEIAAREDEDRNRQPSEEESAEFMRNLAGLHEDQKKGPNQEVAPKTEAVDYKGFVRTEISGGGFELRDGNMKVRVEPTGGGKYQASFRSAKSTPHLRGEQDAVDWAAAIRGESAPNQEPVKNEAPAKTGDSADKDAGNQEPIKNADLASIFTGLASRGLAKSRAQKAADAHPRAEQIAYVQDNFLVILTELEDSGIVKINCD